MFAVAVVTGPELVAKDLVDRDFVPSGPNQLWVTDMGNALWGPPAP
jgi:hypothetical protein